MSQGIQELKQRIAALTDEELVTMLSRPLEYTGTALSLARTEADLRGGLAHHHRETSDPQPDAHGDSARTNAVSRRLRAIGSWLIPPVDRFERFRVLRLAVSLLRILSALSGLAAVGILVGVVGADFYTGGMSHMAFPLLLLFVNASIALVACLSLQATILALVDTERHTRETHRLLHEWVDNQRGAPRDP